MKKSEVIELNRLNALISSYTQVFIAQPKNETAGAMVRSGVVDFNNYLNMLLEKEKCANVKALPERPPRKDYSPFVEEIISDDNKVGLSERITNSSIKKRKHG